MHAISYEKFTRNNLKKSEHCYLQRPEVEKYLVQLRKKRKKNVCFWANDLWTPRLRQNKQK